MLFTFTMFPALKQSSIQSNFHLLSPLPPPPPPPPPSPQALRELVQGDIAVFSCPQRVFGLCERADLMGPSWDLDHTDIEVQPYDSMRTGVWE